MSALITRRAPDTARAAHAIVCDQFCVQPTETVLVTVDSSTDQAAAQAILSAATAAGSRPILLTIPQLPYQGKLADPYIPEALTNAAAASDVWFDMTWPYLAGSSAHDRAMKAGRVRYMLLGDLNAESLQRLYGTNLDRLFEVQSGLDELMAQNEGAQCRVTSPNGTDFTFRLGRPAGKKVRRANSPGTSTPLGSCVFYPAPESVRGAIALDAIFHEFYAVPSAPIRILIDGDIRKVDHVQDHAAVTERSLRRASNGAYGRVIHLSCGFHPATRFTGRSFIEDIRTVGANAIGLGIPWWEPGGGENHPDGIVKQQSLWIEGRQIVRDGAIVAPGALAQAMQTLEQALS